MTPNSRSELLFGDAQTFLITILKEWATCMLHAHSITRPSQLTLTLEPRLELVVSIGDVSTKSSSPPMILPFLSESLTRTYFLQTITSHQPVFLSQTSSKKHMKPGSLKNCTLVQRIWQNLLLILCLAIRLLMEKNFMIGLRFPC